MTTRTIKKIIADTVPGFDDRNHSPEQLKLVMAIHEAYRHGFLRGETRHLAGPCEMCEGWGDPVGCPECGNKCMGG